MSPFLLEIAVHSLERAIAAERAGAHRLELCEKLELGGLTPKIDLLRRIRSVVRIAIHVMVRPRPGNFVYNVDEFAQMKEEVVALHRENIQGIVLGILQSDGSVDVARTRELVALASPLEVTFHRAFDETPDPLRALEDVVESGATRVLSSGSAPSAPEGVTVLHKLIEQAGERILILPGGGLHAGNLDALALSTGAREFHTGLGAVIPYMSLDLNSFESAVRACLDVR